MNSRCCLRDGQKCYEKSPGWAECQEGCEAGMGRFGGWSCIELSQEPVQNTGQASPRAATSRERDPSICSGAGEECGSSRCCADHGFRCFRKHELWSACRRTCAAGKVDQSEPVIARSPWSCEELRRDGPSGEDSGVEVQLGESGNSSAELCAEEGEDCTDSRCCSAHGTRCYEKEPGVGFCMKSCDPKQDWKESTPLRIAWTCNVLAPEAPTRAPRRKLPAPMRTAAVGGGGKSTTSPAASVTGPPEETDTTGTTMVSTTATSTATRRPSPRVRGGPSMYCFALMLPDGYEFELLQEQLRREVGLFSCDAYSVLSSREMELSAGPPRVVTEIVLGSLKCEIGGEYMTALNSEIFVRVWKKVASIGTWRQHDWTLKLDPDCVFLPWRLQSRLKGGSTDDKVYINNFKEGLHGPIEVLSRKAMEVYDGGMERCVSELSHEWSLWGEDVFLRHCLGTLGVNRVDDFSLLTETFDHSLPDCSSSESVAFHPLKKPDDWFACLDRAEE